ncbi:MAG: tetratricopeptide repeat protein [Phycisphaerales bacterium]|nr:tetratricopeptide repeat protein [Phycisphaerales bacterium]MCB9864751.1 tetratricopeptide repeat protein [Phycisphaerales bacterium]
MRRGTNSVSRGGTIFGQSGNARYGMNRGSNRQLRTLNGSNSNRSGIRNSNRSGFTTGNRSGFSSNSRNGLRSTNRNVSRSGNRNGFRTDNGGGFASGGNRSGFAGSGTSNRRSNSGFGNTRFGNNRYGNHSINYQNSGAFGNHSINYAQPGDRGGHSGRSSFSGNRGRHHRSYSRTYGRGFRPSRAYRRQGFGYGGYRSTRFRVGPIYYGHHRYRPYYNYYGRSRFSLGIGFGFYGGCYAPPVSYYYPTYYPAYIGPTYVTDTIVYDDNDAVVVIDNDDPDVLVLDGSGNNSQPGTNVAPQPNVPDYDEDNPLAQKINEGADKFEQGQYDEAVRLFEEVALADRNNADAWFALATAKFATGDYARGASAIRQGVQAFPEMVNTVFDIRDRYGNVDDFQRHIETLERHVESNKDDVDAHIMLGFVYHFTGQRDWAKEVFTYVSDKSPNDQHLARVFINAKEPPPAGTSGGQDPNVVAQAPQKQPRTIVAQPPPQPVSPQPRFFQGSVSDDGDTAPERIMTIDGIVIEYDDVDDKPLETDFKVYIGATRLEFKHVNLGQRVGVRGQSGLEYWITPTAINKDAERVTFSVASK